MTKKVPVTIVIDGRTTVIGTAELDEAANIIKTEIDEEYVHLIQGQIEKTFSLGESPKDKVIREEIEKHNVFQDRLSKRSEHDA